MEIQGVTIRTIVADTNAIRCDGCLEAIEGTDACIRRAGTLCTSGGLVVSCAPESLEAVLAVFERHGFGQASVVGSVDAKAADRPRLRVT